MTNEQKFIIANLLEVTKTLFKLFLLTLLLIQNIVVLLQMNDCSTLEIVSGDLFKLNFKLCI